MSDPGAIIVAKQPELVRKDYGLDKNGKKKPHRYFWHAPGEKPVQLVGVTTVIDAAHDKSGPLKQWAADKAIDRAGKLIRPGLMYQPDELAAFLEEARLAHREVLKEAADAGTAAHEWIQAHVYGEERPMPEGDAAIACGEYLKWRQSNDVEFYEVELAVADPVLGIGGTIDGLARINGKRRVADFKTGKGLYSSHVIQAGKYDRMVAPLIQGDPLDPPLILHIPKDGRGFYSLPFEELLDKKGNPITSEDCADVFAAMYPTYRGVQRIDYATRKLVLGEGGPDEAEEES